MSKFVLGGWFLALACLCGCGSEVPVRAYVAPKVDTEFVSGAGPRGMGPMAGSATSGPRRILGAVVPLDGGCYFIKATDTPDRLSELELPFREVVLKFQINSQSGLPGLELPAGWVMNPRNDVAMAEFIAPVADGTVKFTVTVLGMPSPDQWEPYLLSNINRWRGQLKLAEVEPARVLADLAVIQRDGSPLPAYIFDATGMGSGGMSTGSAPRSAATSESKESTRQPSATNTTTALPKPPIELKYTLPSSWEKGEDRPFRLATFQVRNDNTSSDAAPEKAIVGEVAVSMAVNDPSANAMMWQEQVSRGSDEATVKALAEQAVAQAESIPAGKRTANLYTIRASEQADAPTLLVAAIPMEENGLHVFVKWKSDFRTAEQQKSNLLSFVNSLSWE